MLSVSDAEKLVHAFMTSRLDYCNALLGGCPASSINKLQIVQNAAARVLTRSRKYDHITPILQSLHWLPIKFRISYKILLLAYVAGYSRLGDRKNLEKTGRQREKKKEEQKEESTTPPWSLSQGSILMRTHRFDFSPLQRL